MTGTDSVSYSMLWEVLSTPSSQYLWHYPFNHFRWCLVRNTRVHDPFCIFVPLHIAQLREGITTVATFNRWRKTRGDTGDLWPWYWFHNWRCPRASPIQHPHTLLHNRSTITISLLDSVDMDVCEGCQKSQKLKLPVCCFHSKAPSEWCAVRTGPMSLASPQLSSVPYPWRPIMPPPRPSHLSQQCEDRPKQGLQRPSHAQSWRNTGHQWNLSITNTDHWNHQHHHLHHQPRLPNNLTHQATSSSW